MKQIDWYFDFISPFSYFQLERLRSLPDDCSMTLHPVLFAGLLNHWGMKGPAEVPAKRRFTYRYVQWYATHNDIAFRVPPVHPFNPLTSLRLAIALGNDREAVATIFRFIWRDGRLLDEAADRKALAERLGVDDIDVLVSQQSVKDRLRHNTRSAAELGVFGVPTAMLDGELFWGMDATDMLLDCLRDPSAFEDDEMRRVSDLPVGVQRPGS